uniref:SprT-like domain-containing protein n=1 Tax=Mycena chlorophos TaxID=658473 RepID=A0ABQ0LXK2_MYCCL|nr:predicted protein [Mycena chlorophos]
MALPPQEWDIWECGTDMVLHRPLEPSTSPLVFQALQNLRVWFFSDPLGLHTLTHLSFNRDLNVSWESPLFAERREAIRIWLQHDPPRIDFADEGTASVSDTSPGSPQKIVRIRIARSILRAIVKLEAAIEHDGDGDVTAGVPPQLWIVLFLFERTVLHELAHAARCLFSVPAKPLNIRDREDCGNELEAITGGSVHVYMTGQDGARNFDATRIVGLALQTGRNPDVWRCIDLNQRDLLKKLASVDWRYIEWDLARMPQTVAFAATASSVVCSGGEVATPCAVWANLEEGCARAFTQTTQVQTTQHTGTSTSASVGTPSDTRSLASPSLSHISAGFSELSVAGFAPGTSLVIDPSPQKRGGPFGSGHSREGSPAPGSAGGLGVGLNLSLGAGWPPPPAAATSPMRKWGGGT